MVKKIKTENFEAIVLDKSKRWIRELYDEVFRKTAEKYGKDSLAYKRIINGIDKKNVTGSHFLWNTNLGLYLPKGKKVVLLKDVKMIEATGKHFLEKVSTSFPQVILRSDEVWHPYKYILENLVEQVRTQGFEFSPENPLIISNLELVQDLNSENGYGLLLKIGEHAKLENDSRFAYSKSGDEITFGTGKKYFHNYSDSLSGLSLNKSILEAYYGSLASSWENGRVVVRDCCQSLRGALSLLEDCATKGSLSLINEEDL